MAAATTFFPLGSLFFVSALNGTATTPCNTATVDGKATTTCFAVVNAKGELATTNADGNAVLSQLRFAADGSLRVSGTSGASGSVSVNNFPATQAVNGSVSVSNLPSTQQVSGSVSVANLPTDQAIHGMVTVGNLPQVTGGVTKIDLPMQSASPSVEWFTDVSSCRAFSILVTSTVGTSPTIGVSVLVAGGYEMQVDLKVKNGAAQQWAFPVQPNSDQPLFTANSVRVYATSNYYASSVNLSGVSFCQH